MVRDRHADAKIVLISAITLYQIKIVIVLNYV